MGSRLAESIDREYRMRQAFKKKDNKRSDNCKQMKCEECKYSSVCLENGGDRSEVL